MRRRIESSIHQNVCDYLKLQFRGVLFHTDFAAGVRLTMGQAVQNKRLQSGRAWPDLFIAEPRGEYHGLFIELKREGTRIYLRDGNMTTDAHIREQWEVLQRLQERGYKAVFGVGFDAVKEIIDEYLG